MSLTRHKPIRNNPCKHCGGTNHTSLQCFNKPKKRIKSKPDPLWDETVKKWHSLNPEPWFCYLNISPLCKGRLSESTLTLEHVIPKSRGKKYKYDVKNIKSACALCNDLKGSRDLKSLVKDFPHLEPLI